MIDELSQRARRPLALVVSIPEDRSVQVCRSLVEDGFDAVRFTDVESAEAWLDEETPVVAIIGEAGDCAWDGVIATLEDRGLAAISIG